MAKRKRSYSSRSRRRTFKRQRKYVRARRRYKRTSRNYAVHLERGLVPQLTYCKLRYATTVSITPVSTGVLGNHTIRANSIYDPDASGVGSSVAGIQRLFETYDHCTVTRATIVVDFECSTADATWICGICPTDGAALDASVADANGFRVARRSVFKIAKNSNGEQAPMRRLKYSIDVKKFFGMKTLMGNDKFQHGPSGNPGEQVYFQLCAGAADDSDSVIPTIKAHVYVLYSCVMTEPKETVLA